MRVTAISECERDFIINAIIDKKRLDSRSPFDYRPLKIAFGQQRGCCFIQLGETRVMAQVSCDTTAPKQTRPNEGLVYVSVELSPMAAAHFECGRPSLRAVEIGRILEKCLKESHCVDTEALCIMAGVKVWSIRVDVRMLNDAGNLTDAASIAAITALAHFRRPDFTVSGEKVTVHTEMEAAPIPLSIHHMPLCVTFAFFQQGKYLLVDPAEKEERVAEGRIVIGMNKHAEICCLQMTGVKSVYRDEVLRCSQIAYQKVKAITSLIQQALNDDAVKRTYPEENDAVIEAEPEETLNSTPTPVEAAEAEHQKVNVVAIGTAEIGFGGTSTWNLVEDEELDRQIIVTENRQSSLIEDSPDAAVVISSGEEEEEETLILMSSDVDPQSCATLHIDLTSSLKRQPICNSTPIKLKKNSKNN